ncbi:TylF/MycF/NovP-related O-methyltransferase [Citrifermentans bremense]|uniref:TylF/MycF/NovP-related O-methyltransferase n=1 Tax=Citrifermentans bremense TaxID=60035 RepID=UPI0003F63F00|nr:TylF/MycF/NovP-related O-methyltransferase [Citrifermentans bremense]
MGYDLAKNFEYENGFYLTAPVNRISKFATHLELFRQVAHLSGDIVECGVFKGTSLSRWIKFRSLFGNSFSKKIIAFDTFGEFPETSFEQDKKKREQFIQEAGNQSIGKEELVETLTKLRLYENIDLVAGDILETVPAYTNANPHLKLSLLHIDVDIYEPTRVALETFFPHVVRGGIIIFDDYGAFAGANKAIDDFFAGSDVRILKLPYSHAISYMVKA